MTPPAGDPTHYEVFVTHPEGRLRLHGLLPSECVESFCRGIIRDGFDCSKEVNQRIKMMDAMGQIPNDQRQYLPDALDAIAWTSISQVRLIPWYPTDLAKAN
jgi:hypothetical protein